MAEQQYLFNEDDLKKTTDLCGYLFLRKMSVQNAINEQKYALLEIMKSMNIVEHVFHAGDLKIKATRRQGDRISVRIIP